MDGGNRPRYEAIYKAVSRLSISSYDLRRRHTAHPKICIPNPPLTASKIPYMAGHPPRQNTVLETQLDTLKMGIKCPDRTNSAGEAIEI